MEMKMEFLRKLPAPEELKQQFPVSAQIAEQKAKRDEEICRIFEGKDDRLLLVIGPCSADQEDAVIEYITRLRVVQEKVSDKIYIVPRIYTNKPRTIGVGYKGMLHQPDPEKKPDMLKGIIAIRQMHMRAVQETGFTCADEMLYPENHRYGRAEPHRARSFRPAFVCGSRGKVGGRSAAQADGERHRNSGRNEKPYRRRSYRYDEFDHRSTVRAYVPLQEL